MPGGHQALGQRQVLRLIAIGEGAAEEEQLECYRSVRDEIKSYVETLPESVE